MSVLVTDERPGDAEAIRALVARAFEGKSYSDGTEPQIVDALRAAGDLICSLVALEGGKVVGQIAASPATIGDTPGWAGIGPVAVEPRLQRQGIGSTLVRAALRRLRQDGARGAVLIGDPAFYGRLGFTPAAGLTWRDTGPPLLQVAVLSGPDSAGTLRFAPALEDTA